MKFNLEKPAQALRASLIDKINHKTKPLGALGALESLALQIGLIQQRLTPTLYAPTMLIFAGDHGIANAGVSAYPQAVTAQMVDNFLQGGAAINVFTRQNNMHFRLVDCGVNHVFAPHPDLICTKIAMGTQNFLTANAMTQVQCQQALASGAMVVDEHLPHNCNVVGFGEMGIANTASASCLMSVLCELPIEACVGRGTGLDDAGLAHKINVLSQAIKFHQVDQENPMQVLATFGGFEIATMVGAMLRAAEKKCVLLIDGFISTAALLVAAKLAPNIIDYCIFSHCSDESGHKKMLGYLQAQPLLHLNLRLGEGSGAALAYPVVLAAVNFLNEMASFASAGVSEKSL